LVGSDEELLEDELEDVLELEVVLCVLLLEVLELLLELRELLLEL
jgi:hypothetical protein